jgi:hypothetical protein
MIYVIATIIIAIQITSFYKLKKLIMGAEAVVTEMIDQVIVLITEAFNANVGDLTEAEAEAKKADFIARVTAVLNPNG